MNSHIPVAVALPDEHVFDVAVAVRDLAELADAEPNARIALTIAEVTPDGGIEEQEVFMPVDQAVALASTVGTDQRIPGVSQALYLLRISKADAAAPWTY